MWARLVSLSCNVVLVFIKITALLLVNSLAIAVDLGISVVGLTVSVILYYSIKLSNKPADLIHNYGYGKVENVCEAMEGVVLIGIALAMSSQALVSFLHPSGVNMPWIGLLSSVINCAINFGGAVYILNMAKKSSSPAIYAEGLHYRMEGFISVIIACAFALTVLMHKLGLYIVNLYIDPATALVVSVIVIIPSFKLARNSFFKLLDSSVEEDSQMTILKQLSKYMDKFCEFKGLKTRTSGRRKFIEFKIIVPEDISFRKGHEIVNSLEREISANIPESEVSIKMEPCSRDCEFGRKGQKCPYL